MQFVGSCILVSLHLQGAQARYVCLPPIPLPPVPRFHSRGQPRLEPEGMQSKIYRSRPPDLKGKFWLGGQLIATNQAPMIPFVAQVSQTTFFSLPAYLNFGVVSYARYITEASNHTIQCYFPLPYSASYTHLLSELTLWVKHLNRNPCLRLCSQDYEPTYTVVM